MRISEIENNLPNGFHDSILHSMSIDYVKFQCIFELSILVSTPEEEKAGHKLCYRRCNLVLKELVYISIVNLSYPLSDANSNGIIITSGLFQALPHSIKSHLPGFVNTDYLHWFFSIEFNFFILFASFDPSFHFVK